MDSGLRHRWRLDQNHLACITAGQWRQLLRENRFDVDAVYWHRAAAITLGSVLNSLASRREERRYGAEIAKTVIAPPVFILGHWRTGTTFLHNLMSRDQQFAYPNLYEVLHPGSFLSKGDAEARRWMARALPDRRPMDNVAYDLDLPQEDEFALALTCLRSPALVLNFPRTGIGYLRYLTFDGVPAREVEEWKRTVRWFLKKLTLKYKRPLLLKSPTHTARIRLLLELFPEARFVNIHREPYTVFQSWLHTHDTAAWFMYLQKADRTYRNDFTLRMGQILFDAYFDQRHLVPPGRLVDVAYEDLEARPVEVVQEVYAKLGLPAFEEFRPRLQGYVDSLGEYKKNRFKELAPEVRERVARSWGRAFTEWGYST